jgi:hypothetical protein
VRPEWCIGLRGISNTAVFGTTIIEGQVHSRVEEDLGGPVETGMLVRSRRREFLKAIDTG